MGMIEPRFGSRALSAKVYWISGPWPGHLGIVARPRGGDWLADEVQGWRQAGLDTVVSLLTSEEIRELDLRSEERYAQAEGIEYLSLPVPDLGVPPSRDAFTQTVRRVDHSLAAGKNVAVHCRQGIGRSSVLAASVLAAAGLDPEEAFRRIEAARGRPVPDTREQREWTSRQVLEGRRN